MARTQRALSLAALAMAAVLAGCGLGRDTTIENPISDPIVAATVNGRPIYIEDVRAHAVARGLLAEGEDLDANSDAFFFALEELIQFRLFSMEAEARGLDREPHVRRQLENARERVLAAAIYDEIDEHATDPEAIERLYDENAPQLGEGEEIRLRHIQFGTREEADAAQRRLNQGERFEALAFQLSTERNSAADGGELGFRAVSDLLPQVREAVNRANVGAVVGPIQIDNAWHLIRIVDRRERGVPSLEELRPRIIDWLRFREISQLHERLERDARIERLREPEVSMEPGGDATAPADARPTRPQRPAQTPQPTRPAPDAGGAPGQAPPPFPFPMGPGGGGQAAPTAPTQPPAQQPTPAGDGTQE